MAPRKRKQSSTMSDDKKKIFFTKRLPGFKKKLTELPALCGNSAVCICYAPDDKTHVWPEPKDNPQAAVSQILDKFNAQTDLKKKKNSCDLTDFSDDHQLDGLCLDQLKSHLCGVDSYLVGVKQRESVVRNKTREQHRNLKPKQKETEDHIRVSDNVTVSDHKLGSSEDVTGTKLGFGGVFDDLGYVVLGSNETVTNLGSDDASMVDVGGVSSMDAKSSWLDDPVTLGGHFLLDDDSVWDSLPTYDDDDDWTVSGFDDSFMTNIDNWGFVGGFETQPLMLDS